MTTFEKCFRIVELCKKRAKVRAAQYGLEEIEFHPGYAEPGYSDPESGVVATGNWNTIDRYENGKFVLVDDTLKFCADLLDKIGVELEWSDEWASCEDCGKIFRTSPDSYGWQCSGVISDGSYVCGGCLDPSEHLEALEGQFRQCNTISSIRPADHGYKLYLGDLENGWHHGQDADPEKIAKALKAKGVTRFLFDLTSCGQFDIEFAVFVHESEFHLVEGKELADSEINGPSAREAAEKALKDEPIVWEEISPEQWVADPVYPLPDLTPIEDKNEETQSGR